MSVQSNELAVRGSVLRMASELCRGDYFGGLFILGYASGYASRIIQSVEGLGWGDAVFSTFGISVIIWVACIAGVFLILRDRTVGVGSFEIALGAVFVFLVILPIGPLSWVAWPCLKSDPLHDKLQRGPRRARNGHLPMTWRRASRWLVQCCGTLLQIGKPRALPPNLQRILAVSSL